MSYDEHLISMAGGDGDVLDQIQKRADAATPGPWKADGETRGDCVVWGPNGRFLMNQQAEPHWIEYPGEKRSVSFDVDRRDGEFIAHAREDIPALLAMVREQRAALEQVKVLADKWRYKGEFGWGAWQEGEGPDPEGYALDHAAWEIYAALTPADPS